MKEIDKVIGDIYGIMQGIDLIDVNISTLVKKLDAHPTWNIYKLYTYYCQIIKADLYDIKTNKYVDKRVKDTERKLLERLNYFEERAKYISDNFYIKEKSAIKYEVLKNN